MISDAKIVIGLKTLGAEHEMSGIFRYLSCFAIREMFTIQNYYVGALSKI